MNAADGATWFAARTAGAPAALRTQAEGCFAAAEGTDLPDRLCAAAEAALNRAIASGVHRPAALDLLAADALITLALLAQAEADPAMLGGRALAMRARLAQAA